jgi:hypothetical protein
MRAEIPVPTNPRMVLACPSLFWSSQVSSSPRSVAECQLWKAVSFRSFQVPPPPFVPILMSLYLNGVLEIKRIASRRQVPTITANVLCKPNQSPTLANALAAIAHSSPDLSALRVCWGLLKTEFGFARYTMHEAGTPSECEQSAIRRPSGK